MAQKNSLDIQHAQAEADLNKRKADLDPTAFNNFNEYVAAVKQSQGRSGKVPDRILSKLRVNYNTAVAAQKAKDNAAQNAANPGGQTPYVTPTPTAEPNKTPPANPEVKNPPVVTKKQPTIADATSSNVSGGITKDQGIPQYQSTVGGTSINGEGSFELKSQVADPQAWARTMAAQVQQWRTSASPDSRFKNKLDYIQALIRANGSGGVTGRGILDNSDLSYIKDIAKQALVNGTSFDNLLLNTYQVRQSSGLGTGGTGSFSKTIYSAANLIDQGDAVEKLSDAYFNAYGVYPSMTQINNFRTYWNQNVQRQMTSTTTTTTAGGSKPLVGAAKGGTTKSTAITSGEGFTAEEQRNVMASYLSSQFGGQVKDVKDLGGQALTVYNQLVDIYRSNYQEVPTFKELAPTISELIATPEKDTFQVKLDNIAKKVRSTAAFAFPAATQYLNEGNNLSNIGDQRLKILASKWGTTPDLLKYDKEAQDLIKKSFNYKDANQTARIANDTEFNSMILGTTRYQAGPEAQNWYSNVGNKLLSVVGRG